MTDKGKSISNAGLESQRPADHPQAGSDGNFAKTAVGDAYSKDALQAQRSLDQSRVQEQQISKPTGLLVWKDAAGYHEANVFDGQIRDKNNKPLGAIDDKGQVSLDGRTFSIANSEGASFHGLTANHQEMNIVANADKSNLSGVLANPDGSAMYKVQNGQIFDGGKFVGVLGDDGKVTFKAQDPPKEPVALNSWLNGWVFQSSPDSQTRVFAAGPEMANGKLFLPDQDSKTHEPVQYDVRMGMIIDSRTHKQVGILEPPNTESGHLDGGKIYFFNDKKNPDGKPLAEFKDAVFDLKFVGRSGIADREIQGVSLGKSADGKTAGGLVDLQEAKAADDRKVSAADQRVQGEKGTFNNIMGTLLQTKTIAEKEDKQAKDQRQSDNALVTGMLKDGRVNEDAVAKLETKTEQFKSTESREQKAAEKERKDSENPMLNSIFDKVTTDITPVAFDKKEQIARMSGQLRIDNDVYQIDHGKLYKTVATAGDAHHKAHDTRVLAGSLEPGHVVKLIGHEPISLENQNRVLMQFKMDNEPREYHVLGLGPGRVTDGGRYQQGGLVDADALREELSRLKNSVDIGNTLYDLNRYGVAGQLPAQIAEKITQWQTGKDPRTEMSKMRDDLVAHEKDFNGHINDLFHNGFNKDCFDTNRFDNDVKAAEKTLQSSTDTAFNAENMRQGSGAMQKAVQEGGFQVLMTGATIVAATASDGLLAPVAASQATRLAGLFKLAESAKAVQTAETAIAVTGRIGAAATVGGIMQGVHDYKPGEDLMSKTLPHAISGALAGGAMGVPGVGALTDLKAIAAFAGSNVAQAAAFNVAEEMGQGRNGLDGLKADRLAVTTSFLMLSHFAGLPVTKDGAFVQALNKRLKPEMASTLAHVLGGASGGATYSALQGMQTEIERQRQEIAKHSGGKKVEGKLLWDNLNYDKIVQAGTGQGLAGAAMGVAAGGVGRLTEGAIARPAKAGVPVSNVEVRGRLASNPAESDVVKPAKIDGAPGKERLMVKPPAVPDHAPVPAKDSPDYAKTEVKTESLPKDQVASGVTADRPLGRISSDVPQGSLSQVEKQRYLERYPKVRVEDLEKMSTLTTDELIERRKYYDSTYARQTHPGDKETFKQYSELTRTLESERFKALSEKYPDLNRQNLLYVCGKDLQGANGLIEYGKHMDTMIAQEKDPQLLQQYKQLRGLAHDMEVEHVKESLKSLKDSRLDPTGTARPEVDLRRWRDQPLREISDSLSEALAQGKPRDLPIEATKVVTDYLTHLSYVPKPTAGEAVHVAEGVISVPWKNGEILMDRNKSITVNDRIAHTSRTVDSSGRLMETVDSTGFTRQFTYANSKSNEIVSISSRTSYGTTQITKVDGAWQRQIVKIDGSVDTLPMPGVRSFEASPDGGLRIYDKEGYKDEWPNGAEEFHATDRRTIYRPNLQAERSQLGDNISRAFADIGDSHLAQVRQERFDKLLTRFEERAKAEGLSEESQAGLYKQINRLLDKSADCAIKNPDDRRELAEQILYNAAYPKEVDQGQNETCNVTTIEKRDWARQPDKVAQIVADAAHDGYFITTSGDKIDLANIHHGLTPDKEATQNVDLQREGRPGDISFDRKRSWVSQITELTMVNAAWQKKSVCINPEGVIAPQDVAFTEDHQLLGKLSADNVQPLYDAQNRPILSFDPSQEVFDKEHHPVVVNESDLVYDANGALIGKVEDRAKIQPLYDVKGNTISTLNPGEAAYDKPENGREVIRRIGRGEVLYGKLSSRLVNPDTPLSETTEEEGLRFKPAAGRPFFLKDAKGEYISNPDITTGDFHRLNYEITGEKNEPEFVIVPGKEHAIESGNIAVSNPQELESTLQSWKDQNNFPGVIYVDVGNPPFKIKYNPTDAASSGHLGHVINIWDFHDGLVYCTDQHGEPHEFTISVEALFNAMQKSGQ